MPPLAGLGCKPELDSGEKARPENRGLMRCGQVGDIGDEDDGEEEEEGISTVLVETDSGTKKARCTHTARGWRRPTQVLARVRQAGP